MIPTTDAPTLSEATYTCGPVRLELTYDDPFLREALHGLLNQYDAPWPAPTANIQVTVESKTPLSKSIKPAGTYLRLHNLRADRQGPCLLSVTNLGVGMEFDLSTSRTRLTVPEHPDRPTLVEETEQQLVLLLARAWAQQGWTPLHAGTPASS